jgi:hypothetical protein
MIERVHDGNKPGCGSPTHDEQGGERHEKDMFTLSGTPALGNPTPQVDIHPRRLAVAA